MEEKYVFYEKIDGIYRFPLLIGKNEYTLALTLVFIALHLMLVNEEGAKVIKKIITTPDCSKAETFKEEDAKKHHACCMISYAPISFFQESNKN